MRMEYCATCDKNVDTNIDIDGYNVKVGECFCEYLCGECIERLTMERESREAAEADNREAKQRGEI